MTTPFISIIIDSYNQEKFIGQAIESTLEQDFPAAETEIIVVDDGSTDQTPAIVRKFEPRVRFLQKSNGGQASAINCGVAQAKGTLIAFLDGDDVWLPTKLSRIANEFRQDPPPVMVYNRYCFWDEKHDSTWTPDYFAEVSGDILANRRKLLTYVAAPTSSLAFHRAAIERLMPTPERCSFMHDIYLIGTVICLGPVAAIGECLTKNRVHGENLCFVEGGTPKPAVLRERLQLWNIAIESIRAWARLNTPVPVQTNLETLLRRWEFVREMDAFALQPPGRFQYFSHLCKHIQLRHAVMSPQRLYYNCFYALGALFLGYQHAHYLEGVRTRARRIMALFNRRSG